MFQKNLEAVRIKNPELAERLEKIDINSIDGIDVLEAESNDLIISYKNTLLHSAIDPVREAKTTVNRTIKNELSKNDIQIVFGLGLGYLFKRAYVTSESKIFIIEPFIEVIRFVLEHVDFSNELSDKRVYLTDNVGDIYNKLQKEFLSGDRIEFLFLNQTAILSQELLQNLTLKTSQIMESRGNDENTIFHLCNEWTHNFVLNLVKFPEGRPLGFFEGKFTDKTALIIAAGPSLSEDIEKIKENRNKFTIIAVGKVLKTLLDADIIPDFAVFADAKSIELQIQGIESALEKINLILLSKADNIIFNFKSKSKIFYFIETDSLAKLFEDTINETPGFYKAGSSVAIISYYIAKALGFGHIVFSGLDLAFIEDKIYSNGEKIEYDEEGNIKLLINNVNYSKKLIYVKDKDGREIPTRYDYAWFIRQFNEIFAEEINLARVTNTSLKGAYIKGMEYISLTDVLKTLPDLKPDTDEIISTVFKETEDIWDSAIGKLCPKLQQAVQEFEIISLESKALYEEFNKICNEYKETGTIRSDSESFELLTNNASKVRQMLINNVFTSNSMQNLIWEYTKNYSTKPLPTKEDVIANLELDRDFFRNAGIDSACLIERVQRTFNILVYFLNEKQKPVTPLS